MPRQVQGSLDVLLCVSVERAGGLLGRLHEEGVNPSQFRQDRLMLRDCLERAHFQADAKQPKMEPLIFPSRHRPPRHPGDPVAAPRSRTGDGARVMGNKSILNATSTSLITPCAGSRR